MKPTVQDNPQFHKRALVFVAAACLVAGGAVSSFILRVTPLHSPAVGSSDTSKKWDAAVASNAGAQTGADDPQLFPAGHTFVPVPQLRDEPQPAAGARPAHAGRADSEQWGRRKLASSSTPLSSALPELGSGGGTDGRGYAMSTADVAASVTADKRNDGRGWEAGSRPLFPHLFDDLRHRQHGRAEAMVRAVVDGVQQFQARTKGQRGASESPSDTTGGGSVTAAVPAGGGSRHGKRRREGGRHLHDTGLDAFSDDTLEHDFEAIGDDDGGGICSPLEVVGLDNCPGLNSVEEEGGMRDGNAFVRKALAAKADMLRQVRRGDFLTNHTKGE